MAADPIRITIIYFTNRKFRASIGARKLLDPGRNRALGGLFGECGMILGERSDLLECGDGCPGREVVAAIAAHRMPLSQAEPYLDHLTSCSPAIAIFGSFRSSTGNGRRE